MNHPDISKDTGPVSDVFLGREEELSEIANFIKGNQSVSIIGPRGIGKTSLMLHLLREKTAADLGLEDNLLVYLDCTTLSSCQQDEIIAAFCCGIAAALHKKDFTPEPGLSASVTTPSRIAFETALRTLNHRGRRVVLLLDEFEQITRNPNVDVRFYNAMRSAAGRLRLSFLTSSERPLIELTCFQSSREVLSSPFFNIFSQLFLGLMTESEACHFIRKTMEAAGKEISAQFENFIYQLVGGHPLALQIACFYACDWPDDRNKIESRTKQELEGYFQRDWNNLSRYERDVLLHLPEVCGQVAGKPEIRSILRDLTWKCLVVKSGGSCEYPSKAWSEFVKSHFSDSQI